LRRHGRQIIVEKELEKIENDRKEEHPYNIYLDHVKQIDKGKFLADKHKISGRFRKIVSKNAARRILFKANLPEETKNNFMQKMSSPNPLQRGALRRCNFRI